MVGVTPKLGDSAASYGRALRQNALHTCLSAHPMCHCCKTRAGLAARPLNVVCNVNRRQGLSLAILDVVAPHARIICRSVFFPGFVCFFFFFLFSFFFHSCRLLSSSSSAVQSANKLLPLTPTTSGSSTFKTVIRHACVKALAQRAWHARYLAFLGMPAAHNHA